MPALRPVDRDLLRFGRSDVGGKSENMKDRRHTFARFWKCASQVNPHRYGADCRGEDRGMDDRTYAEALRDGCLAESTQVVGLADHGSRPMQKSCGKPWLPPASSSSQDLK